MAKANQIRAFLGMDLTQFQKGLKKAENRLYRTMRTLDQVGQGLTRTITLPVIAFGAASIKAAADIDKLKKGLEGIMQDAGLAAKEFNNLRKMARNPGLDLKSAIKGSIRLQSIGYSADDARHKLGTLANAVALVGGTGEDLNGVALAITQIIGKGKVQAEEINQIAERLPQVRKAMQDAFGTADTEVLQKMGMSAENFVDDIVNELAKLPKAKASISDTLNNLRDDFNVLAASIGVKLFPIFNKLMGVVLNIINAWDRLSNAQQNSIIKWGLIAAAIGPAILALKGVVAVFHTLTKIMMAKSLFSPWTMAIAAIAAGALLIYNNWEIVKTKIVEIANYFIDLYNDSMAFRVVVQSLILIFKQIWEYVRALGKGIKSVFSNLWTALTNWGEAKSAFKKIGEDFANIMSEFTENSAENIQDALNKIVVKPKIEPITENDVQGVVDAGTAKAMKIYGNFMNLFSGGGAGGGGGAIESIGNNMSGTTYQGGTSGIESIGGAKVISIRPKLDTAAMQEVEANFEVTFGNIAKTVKEKFEDVVDITRTLFGQMSGIVDAFYEKKYIQIENDYQAQKAFIESAVGSERAKTHMMEELEADRAKKVKEIRRKEAIANKARSIFDSLINGAVAVTQALAGPGGPVMAAVVGGMAAAQTALIASTPIPALAKGGLATAPTMAIVGDNKNAKVDPEVIAPLSKLKNMIGGGTQRLIGDFAIYGDDLRLLIDTANYNYSRNSGYGRAV